ncbi:MAG: amylo-alpha-1,6-glucosidase [Candidatus Saccharimonadales bacterium]
MKEQYDNVTVPDGFHLLPNEELVSVIDHGARHSKRTLSSLEQLLRLTRAETPENIGKTGPALAAIAIEASDLVDPRDTPEHLRLYEAVFGRDSLRAAIDLISVHPELCRASVLRLAELQGLEDNIAREEEMGRIAHESRDLTDPVAQRLTKERGWEWPYYGSVDATPEFIRTLTAYCQRTEENAAFLSQEYVDRHGNTQTISHALELALSWIDRRINSNTEGIIEYKSPLPNGIENQVWKDSPDAYHHADGTIANHNKGIASIEVQVTAYDALLDAAEMFRDIFDEPRRANELESKARYLKKAILELFWTEEKGGYFVLGLDRDGQNNVRQMKIRTSNMGHTLNSRLLEGDDPEIVHKREAVARQLTTPEMQNVSGIRTLASDEVRFRPGAYHNGSVWPWDTHHITKGLRRQGYFDAATSLDDKLLQINRTLGTFPEYVRGDNADEPSVNTYTITVRDTETGKLNQVEQPPQEIQAWTVAAMLATEARKRRNP